MDKLAAEAWFSNLPQTDKVIVLLSVMHLLTVAIRDIFLDYADDCETRSRLAYRISELNHRLTSAAGSIMKGEETYPDEVIVEMLLDGPNPPELQPYFPWVLEQAKRYSDNRAGA